MTDVEVKVRVEAPPERVWALVGDPTRMGEWSPECTKVSWTGGAAGPAPGARFRGSNRNGVRRWSTTNTIVTFVPGSELAWDVSLLGMPIAQWTYRIRPEANGMACTVVESFTDRRGGLLQAIGPIGRGVKDVETHNRAGMELTLARIKAAAESPA